LIDLPEYCREIETYLCRKNDGHLIRVVGPSFELVSSWAAQGVPLKVACAGIDRYFERYYRRGPRRRPVKIDFCEADVLDVFDEWRRATGVSAAAGSADAPSSADHPPSAARRQSLPAHLERVVERLSAARASGTIGEAFDAIIDRAAAALDAARMRSGGVRGDARQAMIDGLREADSEMLWLARARLAGDALAEVEREAAAELAPFAQAMTEEGRRRAHEAAVDRLVRERLRLPTISFTA
jgi:hypothetical protein